MTAPHRAVFLSYASQDAEAARVIEQEPGPAFRLIARAWAAGPEGDRALARFIDEFGAEMPGYAATAYGIRGNVDAAFEWYERALARRDAAAVWLKTNSNLRSMHGDPRWPALLRKVGLADEQLK